MRPIFLDARESYEGQQWDGLRNGRHEGGDPCRSQFAQSSRLRRSRMASSTGHIDKTGLAAIDGPASAV
jgi:hypothetical protein